MDYTNYTIVQIMPADGWGVALLDRSTGVFYHQPLIGWALLETPQTIIRRQVVGLTLDATIVVPVEFGDDSFSMDCYIPPNVNRDVFCERLSKNVQLTYGFEVEGPSCMKDPD
jgi:hypothetical protein